MRSLVPYSTNYDMPYEWYDYERGLTVTPQVTLLTY